MGFFREILAAPASWLYGMGVNIRHFLYNVGVFKSEEFDIPIVCVGNLTVGGTGKTPTTEYLVQMLSSYYNVAILSRGYKRKTKGFVLCEPNMSYRRIGDEPKQMKMKFPSIPVAVCEDRREGIKQLRKHHREINLIILDDAYQHRAIEPWVNILLMDYNQPIYNDRMLPLGRLRDTKGALHRAHIVIVTKSPKNLTPLDMRLVRDNLELYPYQALYFTRFKSDDAMPLFKDLSGEEALAKGSNVLAFATIANPKGFFEYLKETYKLLDKIAFPDHHDFMMSDIAMIEERLSKLPEDTKIIMTEKDAVKLIASKRISAATRAKMYYVPVSVKFADGKSDHFRHILSQYVSENQKNNITHPK